VYDVLILGAGAAGLMCAIEAGRRGRRVLVMERNRKVGEKIRISGGGRCNFTNLHTTPDNFISANPDFCKSALTRYTPRDFVALVERHGIGYHEKKLGQLFCNDSSQRIIEMLLAECRKAGVEIRSGCNVTGVEGPRPFRVQTNGGPVAAESLVVATGGLSIPKMGATDLGYRIARQFGLKIQPTRPALVPLTFDPPTRAEFGELSGLSIDSVVYTDGVRFRENLLFTHRGLSGPAILQASSYWRPGAFLTVDLDPDRSVEQNLRNHHDRNVMLHTVLDRFLPRRFVQKWCTSLDGSKPIRQYSSRDLDQLSYKLHHWRVTPAGTEGYARAEVTAGGVNTDELSSKTMESRQDPGLYFIGEVVDVTGQLGGFNFQWAWASGFVAGQNV